MIKKSRFVAKNFDMYLFLNELAEGTNLYKTLQILRENRRRSMFQFRFQIQIPNAYAVNRYDYF